MLTSLLLDKEVALIIFLQSSFVQLLFCSAQACFFLHHVGQRLLLNSSPCWSVILRQPFPDGGGTDAHAALT